MADKKRHLPVLQNREEEEPQRPAWQWVLAGTFFNLFVWLFFMSWWAFYVWKNFALPPSPRWPHPTTAQWLWLHVVPFLPLLGLAMATFAVGCVIGRFGGEAGKSEAGGAGFFAALVGALLAGPLLVKELLVWSLASLAMLLVASSFGYLGGALGVRLRK